MAGGGFLQHMVQSLKGNNALRAKRKKLRDIYEQDLTASSGTADAEKLAALAKIRSRHKRKDQLIRKISSFVIVAIIILLAVTFLVWL